MGAHSRSFFKLPNIIRWVKWIYMIVIFRLDSGSISVSAGINNKGNFNNNQLSESVYSTQSLMFNSNQPHFEPAPKNVTAMVGKSAYLTCRVRNLDSKSVSWVRHRDLHILTVGTYTYTSDQRFLTTTHKEGMDLSEWTMQIKWVQVRDAGVYECQVSTQPVNSYAVTLNVVVPTAAILGGPDLHVDAGSTINITCTIKFSPEPPAYIFWYHHKEVISVDSLRGGVSVVLEKGDVTTSRLLVQNAEVRDSGKYTCSPSNAAEVSVRVHVLNGEHPAAMQTGSAGLSSSARHILPLLLLPVMFEKLRNTMDR